MCRLLGWASQTSTTLHDLLGADDLGEFTELSLRHGDGWGVARSTGRGVSVRKSPDAARSSARFDRWARRRRTELGLAHLRRATLGLRIDRGNTHPFTDGRVAFAHNGSILPPAALDSLIPARDRDLRRGTTDSERYFLAVRARMQEGASPKEALRTTADDIAAVATFTSLNCLLLTPEALHAFCRVDPDGPLEDDDPEYYRLRYRTGPEGVVVSSSGWGRDWQELADGDLLVVRRRTLATSLVAAPHLGVV